MSLRARHCAPCAGDVPRLSAAAAQSLLTQLDGWTLQDDGLHRLFVFHDFRAAIGFINRMAEVAEAENHHPDFTVHYRQVDVTIWTHAVGGLTENDFILAARIADVIEAA